MVGRGNHDLKEEELIFEYISSGGGVREGKVEEVAERGTMGRVGLEKQGWRDRLLLRLEIGWVASFLLESSTLSFLGQDPEQEEPGSSPEPAGLCCCLPEAEPCPAWPAGTSSREKVQTANALPTPQLLVVYDLGGLKTIVL